MKEQRKAYESLTFGFIKYGIFQFFLTIINHMISK
jgi:hypothetical protein